MPLSHYSLECLRGDVVWSFPGGFVDMCISLFLCFSSLVVGLVPQCGCEYLLLGVNVVCHCFCSPCCDLCAAAWVTQVDKASGNEIVGA